MDRFPEKRAFITGAGSGLGRALCLEFATRGWRIAVAEIDPERSRETIDLIARAGGEPLEILCDVTQAQEVEMAAERIKKEWGGVDVVINNVGVSGGGYMEEIPLERWEWIMDLNIRSTIYGCRSFIPILAQ
ncbi:MAG: SDR family NAD(P)-dependent oxidoreductase, partial [Planctomycetes bacterium]|nr:SDR family NAD(P)-dependent oxidoreductase [Planctomycetota bacterium]